jgi:hypothetical protein
MLEIVLPERRPDVTLLWLSEPDIAFHWGGLRSPEAQAGLRAADDVLGEIVAWRDAQPLSADESPLAAAECPTGLGLSPDSGVRCLHLRFAW